MPSLQETAYPRLKSNPSTKAFAQVYTPTAEEIALAQKVTRGEIPRLGFLVLLKTFQTVGHPVQVAHVPRTIIIHIAKIIQVTLSPGDLSGYDASGTRRRHLSVIRKHLNIQPFNSKAYQVMVAAMEKAAQVQHDLVDLINVAIEEIVHQCFELPGFTTLLQGARDVRAASNDALYQSVFKSLKASIRMQLNALFFRKDDSLTTLWNEVKQEPRLPNLTQLKGLVERLRWLTPLQVAGKALEMMPEVKRLHFAAEAQALDANQMKELPIPKRYTLAVALLLHCHSQTLDDIAEVFIKRVERMHLKAKNALVQYRLENQQRTDELIAILRDVVIAHGTEGEANERFAAVDTIIGDRGQELIEQCDAHIAYTGNNYFPFLPQFYRSHRATLFRFLEVVPLHASTQDISLIAAIEFIREHQRGRKIWLPMPEKQDEESKAPLDLNWIPQKWWKLVTGLKTSSATPTQIHRQFFELCVFSHILLELQSGDLYIEGSSAFDDYNRQLLTWEEVEAMLLNYSERVGLPTDGPAFVAHVRAWLAERIETTDQSFPDNAQVNFKNDRLVIQRATPKADQGAALLKQLIAERIRPVNLLDILVDTELALKWTQFFKPRSGYDAKLEQPVARYLATTFCYGCNIGPSQLAQSLTLFDRRQLARVNQRHVSSDSLQLAIEAIINEYNRFQLPKFWGDGKSASVDGTKWDMYEDNLLAEYHIRYGGYGGIGYYHLSNTYIALFSHFIACGVFEAVFLFDGLLKNRSDIQPDTIHGDTHAQSLTVFGLAYLLGIKLMPRIRSWKDLTFFRAEAAKHCQHLDSLFSETVDWPLIETLLPDMLRVVLSIMTGKINASTIVRKLGTNSKKNKLYKAFHALGGAVRTGFLMQYINDPQLRSTIHAGTNKSESFNAFLQWLAFGSGGTLTSNNRDELRKRIKYNHLMANCLIFYNVAEMSRILNDLSQEGYKIEPEAVAGLNPFLTGHANRLGQYDLDLNRQPLVFNYELPISIDNLLPDLT